MKPTTKGKFMEACVNKWLKKGSSVLPCATACEYCYQRGCWSSMHQHHRMHHDHEDEVDSSIPKDVPKGHLVVYVGENHKRYVIKISLLKHPLFKALLDQAQDMYDFTTESKLCIPCEENTFLEVVRCASSPQSRKMSKCL